MPHLNKIKIPGPNDKVYKDECLFSFDNPVSEATSNIIRLFILLRE